MTNGTTIHQALFFFIEAKRTFCLHHSHTLLAQLAFSFSLALIFTKET